MLQIDETFTTMCLSRSSEVRVKVRRWPQSPFGTIFRSSPERWPNKPGKNVRPSVRPSVRKSTIKYNAATNQIVVFLKVDETFTTIRLSRSSEVRVKVTWDLKFQKWWFSKSICSPIFRPIKKIPTVSDTRPKYLKSLRPDLWISS